MRLQEKFELDQSWETESVNHDSLRVQSSRRLAMVVRGTELAQVVKCRVVNQNSVEGTDAVRKKENHSWDFGFSPSSFTLTGI